MLRFNIYKQLQHNIKTLDESGSDWQSPAAASALPGPAADRDSES